MRQIRPYPFSKPFPIWVDLLVIVSSYLAMERSGSRWPLVLLVAYVAIQVFRRFRIFWCPDCRGRLVFDYTWYRDRPRQPLHLICNRCDVVWDTGETIDTRAD